MLWSWVAPSLTFSRQLSAASLAGHFSALSRGSSRSSESSWGCLEQALRNRLPPALGRLLQGACRGRAAPGSTRADFAYNLPPASFVAPPPSTTRCVHTRDTPKSLSSAARNHPPLHVPSSWSLTTSTAYSAPRFRACCSSSRPWGSSRFGACSTTLRRDCLAAHVLVTLTPLDEVPSPSAGTHHCALLPSCRFLSSEENPRLQGLAPMESP